MYAGSLNKIHGIEYLVRGFIKADLSNAELHIYGDGDFVPEIKKIEIEHKNIKYHGVKLNQEIVKEEVKATLLINPRPTNQEFVKYSFPSKNMEYLVSGTPLLTTRLPGMPMEYYPYIYTIDAETDEGLCKTLRVLLSKSKQELHEKGKRAKMFVLENKNENIQGKKIVLLLNVILYGARCNDSKGKIRKKE